MTVAKSFSPTAVAPGADATLSLAITNPNTVAVSLANPGLTDSFPPNLRATGGADHGHRRRLRGLRARHDRRRTRRASSSPAGTRAGGRHLHALLRGQQRHRRHLQQHHVRASPRTAGTTGPPSNTASLGVGLVNIAKNFAPDADPVRRHDDAHLHAHQPDGRAADGRARSSTRSSTCRSSGDQAVGGTCTGTTPAALANGQTVAQLHRHQHSRPAAARSPRSLTSNVVGTHPNAANGVTTALLPQGPGSNTDYLTVVGKPTIAKAFSPAGVALNGASTHHLHDHQPERDRAHRDRLHRHLSRRLRQRDAARGRAAPARA